MKFQMRFSKLLLEGVTWNMKVLCFTKYIYTSPQSILYNLKESELIYEQNSLATVGWTVLLRNKDILVWHLEIQLFMEDEW